MKSFARKLIIPLCLTVFLTSVTAEAGVAGHGAAAREAESGPGVNMTQAAEETSPAETVAAEETEAALETAAAETEAAQETAAAAEMEAAAQSSAAEGTLTMIAAGDNLSTNMSTRTPGTRRPVPTISFLCMSASGI